MKAIVRNTSLATETRPAPTPGPGEALIRPIRVAIARADVLAASGVLPFRGVLGHQFVGTVESVLPTRDEHRAWVGKRVVGSISVVCARCDRCKGGLSAHCQQRTVLGLAGRDGCLAEAFTLPIANLVELPKGIHDDAAIFAEPLAAAIHAAQVCRFEGRPYVTILGDGPLGLLCAQVMARLNASVRVLGRYPAKFSLAERWGIKHRHEGEVGRRHDQDVVIDCTGSPEGLALALRLVRPRGKIIVKSALAPVPEPPIMGGVDLSPAVVNEIELHGVRCGKLQDAVATLARGEIDTSALISKRVRFADALTAFDLAKDKNTVRVIVEM